MKKMTILVLLLVSSPVVAEKCCLFPCAGDYYQIEYVASNGGKLDRIFKAYASDNEYVFHNMNSGRILSHSRRDYRFHIPNTFSFKFYHHNSSVN